MNLGKLWIPTLLLTLIGGGAKICDTLFNFYGDGFFLNSMILNGIFVCSFLLLLIIGWGMSISDRKKVFSVSVKKNAMCGIFGFIASVCIISTGIISLTVGSDMNSGWLLFYCLTSVAGGGMLLYESCMSFIGNNGISKMPVLTLLVPVWSSVRFVTVFSQYSSKSIASMEMFDIISVAFLIMFLFYQAMFFAGLNNRTAVRRTVVYGNVFIMIGLVVSADMLIKMGNYAEVVSNIDTQSVKPTITNIVTIAGDLSLCLYAMFFTAGLLKEAKATLKADEEEDEDEMVYLFENLKEDGESASIMQDTVDKAVEAAVSGAGVSDTEEMFEEDGLTDSSRAEDDNTKNSDASAVSVQDTDVGDLEKKKIKNSDL